MDIADRIARHSVALVELHYLENFYGTFPDIVDFLNTTVSAPFVVVSDNDENTGGDTCAFMEWMEKYHQDMIVHTTEWVENPNSYNNIRAMLIKTCRWDNVDTYLKDAYLDPAASYSCCGLAMGDADGFTDLSYIEDDWERVFYAITIKFGDKYDLEHCDWSYIPDHGRGIGVYVNGEYE